VDRDPLPVAAVLVFDALLLLTVGLLVGRGTRTFGWAVLLGSVEGFAGMFVFLIAALAAALGGD
jgi:hypothetical protein